MINVAGSFEHCGVFSIPQGDIIFCYLSISTVPNIPHSTHDTPTCIIFSHFTAHPPEHSKYPQGSHDTVHGNEHSHGAQGISQFYHDIPYDTEPPSWYSRYFHGTQDIPTVLNTLHGTEHTLYVVILVDHPVRLPILDREGYTADLFTI